MDARVEIHIHHSVPQRGSIVADASTIKELEDEGQIAQFVPSG